MFTGIIEATGTIRSLKKRKLWIDVSFADELKKGQSVACNGVCLTVIENDRKGFSAELLEETWKKTTFSEAQKGHLVNLERALKADGRFDGHIVQAHVEGIGVIKKIVQEKRDWLLKVQAPKDLLIYIVKKGIIILDGIALTITHIDDKKKQIQVAITAYTWENTNLHFKKIGDQLNIETDLIAKYVARLACQA